MFSKKYRGKIDYSSEARINFIERMSSIMINFVSISDEVNKLINILYSKLTRMKANYNIFHDKESKKEVGSKAGSKPQSEEGQLKGMKMKSCIFNIESEKKKDKKAILSMNLNREKSTNFHI